MDYLQFITDMPPELYERLKLAVERGKWPDGRRLTTKQRDDALQAIIAWGEMHLAKEERVGFVKPKPVKQKPVKQKKPGASPDVSDESIDSTNTTPLRWKD